MKRLLCVAIVTAALVPASLAQWRTLWESDGPKGPAHWSTLDPAYAACGGRQQSPIDIRQTVKAALPALRFEYKPGLLTHLQNNGHTIRVNYYDVPNTGNFLIVGEKRYQLNQFHFHRPGEERIDGKSFDMDIHLVHTAADGSVVIVAVGLKAGHANNTIQRVWDHMPKTENRIRADFSHEEQSVPGVEIDPAALLPRNLAYYEYTGSLTAPPCTENQEWFILKTPVEISGEQIEAYSRLYPNDARPVQPLNGRIVHESR